jgi:hypothetical protein
MRGDSVVVYVDTGAAEAREFVITASKNGREVEVKNVRNMIEVSEVMHTGKVVKTDRFMAARVIALIENRSEEPEAEPTMFITVNTGTDGA